MHFFSTRLWMARGLVTALSAANLGACANRCESAPAPRPTEPLRPAVSTHELSTQWRDVGTPPTDSPDILFFEAEAPSRSNFPDHHPFEPESTAEAEKLSGGHWLGADKPTQPLFAEYAIPVRTAGTYRVFARKFWRHCPFRWRLGNAGWQTVTARVALLDNEGLRLHVGANWVEIGEASLDTGPNSLRLEVDAGTGGCAFDAFALTLSDFKPRGRLRPGDKYPTAPQGLHVFDPPLDDFHDSPIDLRRLNQAKAGEDGFVRAKDGDFVFERSGKPVRFWGMNSGTDVLALSPKAQQRFARRLAKSGINLLRLHGRITRDDDLGHVDPVKLAGIRRLIATLRDQGIYLALSIYFPVWFELSEKNGFPGYGGKRPFALPYFDERLQGMQRAWWRELLTAENPNTGFPLAKDPALALVELVNEDSTLFWTFKPYESIPEAETIALERRFAEFLGKKYGSLDKAFQHWDGDEQRGDDLTAQRAGLVGLWNIVHEKSLRAQDTAEFLARLMREYYESMQRTLRTDLGVEALTVCSNWHTADERVLGPLDNWANSVCDVMDRHGYLSGLHEGDAASFDVRDGQRYDDRSALRFDFDRPAEKGGFSLPLLEPRINGKPLVVSELGWPWPNRFRAEAPLLTAAYASLHGVDAPMFFATAAPYGPARLGKFESGDPVVFGQFPGAALAYRRGLIRQAEPVAVAEVPLSDLFALEGVPLATQPGLDTLRARDVPQGASADSTPLSPLALLAGPVEFGLDRSAQSSFRQDALDQWLNPSQRTAQSRTGELSWDAQVGVLRIEAPVVQGAVGFLAAAGTLELPNLTVSVRNEYGTVLLVAMDDAPIADSKRLLLQVMTEATNAGWAAPGEGPRTIQATGGPPIWLRDVDARVQLKGFDNRRVRVTALDANGYPTSEMEGVDVPLRTEAMYYAVQAD